MGKKISQALFAITAVLLAAGPVFSATVREELADKLKISRDICPAIKSSISSGTNTKEVVKTAIQMGQPACYVIKCALDAGGGLDQVVLGAIEAGATGEVTARCATDAGAQPEDVARVLEREGLPGLGYTPPPTGPSPITVTYPGGDRPGGFMSPSSFR